MPCRRCEYKNDNSNQCKNYDLKTTQTTIPLRQHCSAAENIFINNTNNEEATIKTIPWQAPMLGARRSCLSCLQLKYPQLAYQAQEAGGDKSHEEEQ